MDMEWQVVGEKNKTVGNQTQILCIPMELDVPIIELQELLALEQNTIEAEPVGPIELQSLHRW